MSRDDHEFQFLAGSIAKAAEAEAEYHRKRLAFWETEYEVAVATVKKTAFVEVKTYPVTGGQRADVSVNYGDPSAYKRMVEAFDKIDTHRTAMERFITDARVYGTQTQRTYDLSVADVHYFRLGGERRPT